MHLLAYQALLYDNIYTGHAYPVAHRLCYILQPGILIHISESPRTKREYINRAHEKIISSYTAAGPGVVKRVQQPREPYSSCSSQAPPPNRPSSTCSLIHASTPRTRREQVTRDSLAKRVFPSPATNIPAHVVVRGYVCHATHATPYHSPNRVHNGFGGNLVVRPMYHTALSRVYTMYTFYGIRDTRRYIRCYLG